MSVFLLLLLQSAVAPRHCHPGQCLFFEVLPSDSAMNMKATGDLVRSSGTFARRRKLQFTVGILKLIMALVEFFPVSKSTFKEKCNCLAIGVKHGVCKCTWRRSGPGSRHACMHGLLALNVRAHGKRCPAEIE